MLILAANPKLCERICICVFFPFLLHLYSPEPSELRKARKIVRTNLCYLLCPWELGRDCLIWIEGNDELTPSMQIALDICAKTIIFVFPCRGIFHLANFENLLNPWTEAMRRKKPAQARTHAYQTQKYDRSSLTKLNEAKHVALCNRKS